MNRKYISLHLVVFIFFISFTLPTACWLGQFRTIRHPLNWPDENPSLFELIRTNPRIHNASQVAFIGVTLACMRLLNKSYTPQHFALREAFSPDNLMASPLKCIDDGLIGHPGNGHQPAYGILGTSWAAVPKIDNAFVAIDSTQRKMQAWTAWLQKNLRSLENQSPLEQWWHQIRNAVAGN